jgi:hypothetical protein
VKQNVQATAGTLRVAYPFANVHAVIAQSQNPHQPADDRLNESPNTFSSSSSSSLSAYPSDVKQIDIPNNAAAIPTESVATVSVLSTRVSSAQSDDERPNHVLVSTVLFAHSLAVWVDFMPYLADQFKVSKIFFFFGSFVQTVTLFHCTAVLPGRFIPNDCILCQ